MVHGPQLEVLVPHLPQPPGLPGEGGGFGPAQHEVLQGLLQRWWQARGLARPLAWISTPMALPLAQALRPRALVLDCADELAGFLNPPSALDALEQAALEQADLVLAAGAALAAPRAQVAGSRLRLLHNGADTRLFRPRGPVPGSWECAEAALLRPGVPGPQLGHAGVIDERIDLALLEALADARPQWQLVMVGPVVKIDPAQLPRRPNLHWLGEQPYRVLPGLMAAWRAMLLPFADNLATRHASPIKLLEALAAGLPAVATRLPGIAELCARADPAGRVRLAEPGPPSAGRLAHWLAVCEEALADHRVSPPLPRALHWDRLATAADRLLCEVAGVTAAIRGPRASLPPAPGPALVLNVQAAPITLTIQAPHLPPAVR